MTQSHRVQTNPWHREKETQNTDSYDIRINKVSKGAKIRNRYNQVPHLTQDTNGKVITSQLDTTNESKEVSPFSAGDHKAQINRRAQRENKNETEKNIKDPQKKYRLGTVSKIFYGRALTGFTAPTSPLIQSKVTRSLLLCKKTRKRPKSLFCEINVQQMINGCSCRL